VAPEPGRRTTGDYAKKLFHNVYNYTLLGGVATAALATGQWWLGLVGVGLEAMYMLYAPDSKTIRNSVDKAFEREAEQERARARMGKLQILERDEKLRCAALMSKQQEITHLASENPSFTGQLLSGELGKLDRLVDAFIDLSWSTCRSRQYLQSEDVADIEQQARSYEKAAEKDELAKKNLAIVTRRLERLRDIQAFVSRASGQLELIENSFGLLADQIVSMRSPGEMSGQLDDLLDGVEAVRETAREAEQLLQPA
jgi:hypothetical protein